MKRGTKLHFVGIGGIGMSGIAEVFFNQGYPVSGSDLADSETTKRLRSLGLQIFMGHKEENVQGADVVVISSAVKETNPEVVAAKRLRIPVIPRAEMLGELMRGKTGIAIAGTHGKTTTTSMLATILTQLGLDPTLVIGGKVDSLGGNAKLGLGPWVVAEADESDASFLHLPATYGVITNIDSDHLDFFGNIEAVENAFVNFVSKIPFYGAVAVCGEDPGVRRCIGRFTKPVLTYGFSSECDVYADQVTVKGFGSRYRVLARQRHDEPHQDFGVFETRVPGIHNVLNSLAAITLSHRIGLDLDKVRDALLEFGGVKRRFEVRWRDDQKAQIIVDDYGHHPTEVMATLHAARAFWPGRIITVFQPHRFSRTVHCREAFLTAFDQADVLLLTDIYAAGEEPIEGVDSERLAEDLRKSSRADQEISYVGDLESAGLVVRDMFKPGDMILCLGAGSITRLPEYILQNTPDK